MSMYHPQKSPNSWRIGRRRDRKFVHTSWLGKSGINENFLREILNEWQQDDLSYCHMDFSQPTHIARAFMTEGESLDDFTPMVIGKEVGQSYFKGAFRTKTGNIVLRSATYSNLTTDWRNGAYKSLVSGWIVQKNIFDADKSFFVELKQVLN